MIFSAEGEIHNCPGCSWGSTKQIHRSRFSRSLIQKLRSQTKVSVSLQVKLVSFLSKDHALWWAGGKPLWVCHPLSLNWLEPGQYRSPGKQTLIWNALNSCMWWCDGCTIWIPNKRYKHTKRWSSPTLEKPHSQSPLLGYSEASPRTVL